MSMFDYLHCKVPLPDGKPAVEFQTKFQCWPNMDYYEIRDDGLWRQDYDIEDRSDPNATDFLRRIAGCMTRVNQRWVRFQFTGEIVFYDDDREFSAYFIDGELKHLISLTPNF